MTQTLDLARPNSLPEDGTVGGTSPRRPRRTLFAALFIVLVASVSWGLSSIKIGDIVQDHNGPILVVGDSLVVQATQALRSWNLPSTPIMPEGGSGSAPCDWNTGYVDPISGDHLKFSTTFQRIHPAAVVFAFTGNPGLEPRITGCVNSSRNYTIAALLASYREALTEMATYASKHGAAVYLSATPPRNPATPAGTYLGSAGNKEYGFNGVPALNELYKSIARSKVGTSLHWTYDPYPAEYVSTKNLTWRMTERCRPWNAVVCAQGVVEVRSGGLDAIHLDPGGSGAVLYAIGLVKLPLDEMSGSGSSNPILSALAPGN